MELAGAEGSVAADARVGTGAVEGFEGAAWDAAAGWLRRCKVQKARTSVITIKGAASFSKGTRREG
jgi:hypothetical protein